MKQHTQEAPWFGAVSCWYITLLGREQCHIISEIMWSAPEFE